jgi:hypothetical protein
MNKKKIERAILQRRYIYTLALALSSILTSSILLFNRGHRDAFASQSSAQGRNDSGSASFDAADQVAMSKAVITKESFTLTSFESISKICNYDILPKRQVVVSRRAWIIIW